jgi:hypothetical protein
MAVSLKENNCFFFITDQTPRPCYIHICFSNVV